MINQIRIAVTAGTIALGCVLSGHAHAEEGVTHYEALPSETLEQALDNFITYNAKVADVLAREDLSVQDMEEIHEYTYTLEIALARINEELGALPVALERLHIASEGDNTHELRAVGEVYLETASKLGG